MREIVIEQGGKELEYRRRLSDEKLKLALEFLIKYSSSHEDKIECSYYIGTEILETFNLSEIAKEELLNLLD